MARDPQIIERLVLTAELELVSPLLIGTGENDNLTDTLVLKTKEGYPIIPGTSLAGVLRGLNEEYDAYFGLINVGADKGESQSSIVISDVVLDRTATIIRDSVHINEKTGTAEKGAKFDYEAVERGAKGQFKLVATIRGWQKAQAAAIRTAVENLGKMLNNELFLGAHTRKGFGKVVGHNVVLRDYDFSQPEDVTAWLLQRAPKIEKRLQDAKEINPNTFSVEAELKLRGSLIVRTAEFTVSELKVNVKKPSEIKAAPLKSLQDYVIPGATVRGVVRKQARNILEAMGKDLSLLDKLFGYSDKKTKESRRGKLIAEEIYFHDNVKEYKQARNKIDRFTGATVDSALFSEVPLTQRNKNVPALKLRLVVEDCEKWEAGLLLFILKDIFTGQVAFGGEKSVGRGTMEGVKATICYKENTFGITAKGGKLQFSKAGAQQLLETWAQSLVKL